jgi:hypothetical protein
MAILKLYLKAAYCTATEGSADLLSRRCDLEAFSTLESNKTPPATC